MEFLGGFIEASLEGFKSFLELPGVPQRLARGSWNSLKAFQKLPWRLSRASGVPWTPSSDFPDFPRDFPMLLKGFLAFSGGFPDLPKDCFPKDQLAPSELLPANAQSQWSNVNPSGQGKLGDQNFLSAGYHFGTDTVGQSLRNANRQLRSEPANPQVKVSPWNQTTIEPDINRRPLEIGGC